MDDKDGYFGEGVVARYDGSCADMFEPGVVDAVVEVLAGLAGGGRALELGIGTGRIALPLARRGVALHGIDLSRAMVFRLRAKPGGEALGVRAGPREWQLTGSRIGRSSRAGASGFRNASYRSHRDQRDSARLGDIPPARRASFAMCSAS
jgi:SAM-dependent methyltransferase